jgi:hypothetical protein
VEESDKEKTRWGLAHGSPLLISILLIAFVVRFWGIGFGLPNTRCRPDEYIVVETALRFGTGDFNPHTFWYGTLYMYALFSLYVLYFLLGVVSGQYSSTADFLLECALKPTNVYLIDRCFVAVLGSATVVIVYLIAKNLFDRKTGLISSVFMALAYLHVRDSHFGVLDVPMTFLIMCSVLYIVRSYTDTSVRNYVIAGIFAGMATSLKYAGVLLSVPMCIVHVFNVLASYTGGGKVKLLLDKRVLLFGVALSCTFFLGTPYALLDYSKFFTDFSFSIGHVFEGHVMTLDKGWWHYLRFSLFYGLGWSLLFASIAGILVLIKRNPRKALVFCSFPMVYYILSGRGYTVFARYIIPVVPFLCITAAILVAVVDEKIGNWSRAGLRNVATCAMVMLIIWPSVYSVFQFDRLLSRKDNRLVAAAWVYDHIPPKSSIYQWGDWTYANVWLRPTLDDLKKELKERVAKGGQGILYQIMIKHWEQESIEGYNGWTYDDELKKFKFGNKVQDGLPDCIMIQESPLLPERKPPARIEALLQTSYGIKKSFEVVDIDDRENVYDQQDAFYLPFAGFGGIERPGPNIYIYERK